MDRLVKLYSEMGLSAFKEELTTIDTKQLIIIKDNLNNRYYNTGEDVIDDTKYDLIADELTRRGEKLATGCKLRDGDNAVLLPYYIGGMDKVKCGEDKRIAEWAIKNKSPSYIVSNKLNGVSCLAVFGDKGVKLYTRGDCTVGADISYLAKNIHGLPTIKSGIVRGELIIRDKDYLADPDKKKNCLSTIIGAVNSKTLQESVNKIRFVAFDLVDETVSHLRNLKKLKSLGFEVVYHEIVTPDFINSTTLTNLLIKRKDTSIYDLDGLVIQGDVPYVRTVEGNPSYAVAFKANFETADAEVVDVVWEISRYGIIKPQVKIVPTKICNITNVSLSGFNAKFIKDNVIGKGSIIKITRSGDVIPYILGVVKPSGSNEPLFPDYDFLWTKTGVDIFIADKVENAERSIAQISHFFKTLNVKHISDGVITKLYNGGYKTIKSILELDPSKMTSITGIGDGIASRILEVHASLKNININYLILASGIFEGFGEKKIRIIMSKTSYTNGVLSANKEELIKLEGISDITAARFINKMPLFKKFYDEISLFVTTDVMPVVTQGIYSKSIFVFSGFRDKSLEEIIKHRGGDVGATITKTTTHLVVKDTCGASSKITAAKKMGIEIVTPMFFK